MTSVDRAVELNPTYAAAHALRGDLLAARQDLIGAAASYQEAARCAPTNPVWIYRAAQAYFQLEQWEQAAEALEVVTRRAPATAQAFHMLGLARFNLGQLPQARTALLKARELAPQNPAIDAALRQVGSEQTQDG